METDEMLYDYEKAKRWREDSRLTRRQLAELTGFSISAITNFETGIVRGNKARPVDSASMKRYRLILAAITHGLTEWDWTGRAP